MGGATAEAHESPIYLATRASKHKMLRGLKPSELGFDRRVCLGAKLLPDARGWRNAWMIKASTLFGGPIAHEAHRNDPNTSR